jgi:hypothetical protein
MFTYLALVSSPVTLAIDRGSQGRAGFVPLSNGGAIGLDAARPLARLDGCPGVLPARQAVKGLADVGYSVSIAIAGAMCVPIDVTPTNGSTRRVVLCDRRPACPS